MPLRSKAGTVSMDQLGRLRPPPLVPHPFTVMLLIITLFSGFSLLLGGPQPTSMEALFPQWAVYVWAVMLIIGGTFSMFGVYWRDMITGLLLEVAGCIALAPACALYCWAAFVNNGFSKAFIFPVLLVAGFGVASLFRIYQIQRFIQALRHLSQAVTLASDLYRESEELTEQADG